MRQPGEGDATEPDLERPQKRPRTEDVHLKKPARRRVACQSCRIRKVKCDNSRPTCAICASSGSECVYIESTAAPTYVVLLPLAQIDLMYMQSRSDDPADDGSS